MENVPSLVNMHIYFNNAWLIVLNSIKHITKEHANYIHVTIITQHCEPRKMQIFLTTVTCLNKNNINFMLLKLSTAPLRIPKHIVKTDMP